MVAVTYGVAPIAERKSASKKKGLFATLYKAICDSQMKRAQREIARYRYLIPRAADGIVDDPFNRS